MKELVSGIQTDECEFNSISDKLSLMKARLQFKDFSSDKVLLYLKAQHISDHTFQPVAV